MAINPASRWAAKPSTDSGSGRSGGSLLGGMVNMLGAKGRTEYELAMHREHNAIDTESYGQRKTLDTKSEVTINKKKFKHQNRFEVNAQRERLKDMGVIIGSNPDGTPAYNTERQKGLRRVGDVEMQAEGLLNRGKAEGDEGEIPTQKSRKKKDKGGGGVEDVTPVPTRRAELIAKLEDPANHEGRTPEEIQGFKDKANELRHKRDVAPDDGNKADRNLGPSRTESNVTKPTGNAGANADLGNIQDAAAATVAEGMGTSKPKNPRGSGKSAPPKATKPGNEDDFRINK